MRRRLFLEWFTKGVVGAAVVGPKVFDMHVEDPMIYANRLAHVTVISSRDMRIPLQLRPGGNFGMFNPDGGGLGIGRVIAEREFDLVGRALPKLFERDDAFFRALEKLNPEPKRPVQKSLFDIKTNTTIPLIDDEPNWDEDW